MTESGDAEESPVGAVGWVTVSIPADGPGEVLVPVRGGSEAFAAWADVPIGRNTQVMVTDRISARSVLVVPFPRT
ncbi:hypothetical protein OG455_32850 [Kitasatospora sp. NBC_01287]|uniref:hypothetical protein n=1 Tax=Kitasatospora sp. NBC_01287 TaxID=2903573 RepID=UPI0022595C9E|nr:hypothetical protein [Kitasatospora sp. NBC_01287]MCX4750248.1 hypothetical protein [Kitasatospora sp. NBC_01287]